MNIKILALSIGAFLLSACNHNDKFARDFIGDRPYTVCVIGFTQTSKNKGTLGIYTDSKPAIVEDIKDVSYETAQDITHELGLCSETLR